MIRCKTNKSNSQDKDSSIAMKCVEGTTVTITKPAATLFYNIIYWKKEITTKRNLDQPLFLPKNDMNHSKTNHLLNLNRFFTITIINESYLSHHERSD